MHGIITPANRVQPHEFILNAICAAIFLPVAIKPIIPNEKNVDRTVTLFRKDKVHENYKDRSLFISRGIGVGKQYAKRNMGG
jgi:hypothetical protein